MYKQVGIKKEASLENDSASAQKHLRKQKYPEALPGPPTRNDGHSACLEELLRSQKLALS